MSEGGLREVTDKTQTRDDSVRIIGIRKPLEGGDNKEEYNDNKLNAKREKFKMGAQGCTSTIG